MIKPKIPMLNGKPARRCIGRCGKLFNPSCRFDFICQRCEDSQGAINPKEYRIRGFNFIGE